MAHNHITAEDAKYLASLKDQDGRGTLQPASKPVEDRPISWASAVKVISILIAVITYAIGSYAWIASIDKKVDLLAQEQHIAHSAIDRQLTVLVAGQESSRIESQAMRETLIKTNLILEQFAKNQK